MADRPNPRSLEAWAVGLCAHCAHGHRTPNDRGSVFYRCGYAALDPRFVKKLISNKQFDVAKQYMAHVVDQAATILKHRKVSGLFTTPKLLEALGEQVDLWEAGIRGVFCGGTSMKPQEIRFIIEELLERSVGQGKVRAQVNADMDYDRVVTNTESFDPDGQVVRSTQAVNEKSNEREAGSGNVTVQNNLPGVAAAQAGDIQITQSATQCLCDHTFASIAYKPSLANNT